MNCEDPSILLKYSPIYVGCATAVIICYISLVRGVGYDLTSDVHSRRSPRRIGFFFYLEAGYKLKQITELQTR